MGYKQKQHLASTACVKGKTAVTLALVASDRGKLACPGYCMAKKVAHPAQGTVGTVGTVHLNSLTHFNHLQSVSLSALVGSPIRHCQEEFGHDARSSFAAVAAGGPQTLWTGHSNEMP